VALFAGVTERKVLVWRVPRKIVIAFGRDQDPLGGVLLFISDPGDITNDLVGRRVIRKVIKGGGCIFLRESATATTKRIREGERAVDGASFVSRTR
jgi:hypothetical protein